MTDPTGLADRTKLAGLTDLGALPEQILRCFQVSDPVLMTTTVGASLWQVHCAKRGRAVLKYYGSRGMGNEAAGFRFLADAPDAFAAQIYKLRQDAALIEWLEGPFWQMWRGLARILKRRRAFWPSPVVCIRPPPARPRAIPGSRIGLRRF